MKPTHLKLLACLLATGSSLGVAMPVAAQDKTIATVVKIAGIQWFNRMEEGVKQFATDTGNNAFQVGPAQADPQQSGPAGGHDRAGRERDCGGADVTRGD